MPRTAARAFYSTIMGIEDLECPFLWRIISVLLMVWVTLGAAVVVPPYAEALERALQRSSAAIDWCEPNYVYSENIAEFFNTISNILFFTFPPIVMWLFQLSYARPLSSPSCHLVFILLIVIGITSVYFHATLSLLGQLLDEISILWVIIMGYALWTPYEYMPAIYKRRRSYWQMTLCVLAVMVTCASWVAPIANAILLLVLGLPVTYIIAKGTQRSRYKDPLAYKMGIRCLLIWIVALCSWVSDRLHCQFWLGIGFPYMHAIWHLLVAMTAYQACVLLCFYNSLTGWLPEYHGSLHLWPSNDWLKLGVPYVVIQQRHRIDSPLPM